MTPAKRAEKAAHSIGVILRSGHPPCTVCDECEVLISAELVRFAEKARAEAVIEAAAIIRDECLKEEFPDMQHAAIRAINKLRELAKKEQK